MNNAPLPNINKNEKCKKCKFKNINGIFPLSCKTCNPVILTNGIKNKKEWKKEYRKKPEVIERERKTFVSRYLKRVYKISIEQYNEMLLKQNSVCAICKTNWNRINPKSKKIEQLSVDHCHKTGKIRGLLCSKCNPGLGHFNDDPRLLYEAIKYLNG